MILSQLYKGERCISGRIYLDGVSSTNFGKHCHGQNSNRTISRKVVLASTGVSPQTTSISLSFVPTSSTVSLVIGASTPPFKWVLKKYCKCKKIQVEESHIVRICDDIGDKYRYGFNGQEKVNELKGIGNSLDFGARIYDSRVGKWLSLDPLAAKYPSMSPYNFVGGNPIMFIDPDGQKITIYYAKTDENGSYIKKEDGTYISEKIEINKLSDLDNAIKYSQNSYFVSQTVNALNHLLVNNADAGIISTLIEDENINISISYDLSNSYDHKNREVHWNSEQGVKWFNEESGNFGFQSPAVQLLHELGHGFRDVCENIPNYKEEAFKNPEVVKLLSSNKKSDINKGKNLSKQLYLKAGEEEGFIMENYEQPASSVLGEDVRPKEKYIQNKELGEGNYETQNSTSTIPR